MLDNEHEKLFLNVLIVGSRDGKSLKYHLVRARLPILNSTLGNELCGKRNCKVFQLYVQILSAQYQQTKF